MPIPLVERSEEEIAQNIRRRVESMKGVKGCRNLSVRISSKRVYVDMQVLLDNNISLEGTHKAALEIERDTTHRNA